MLNEILTGLGIKHSVSEREQELLERHLFTVLGWQMLNALCYANEASLEFRKEEDDQPHDEQILEKTQQLYLGEIDRINSFEKLGITLSGSKRLTDLEEVRRKIRQELRERWKRQGDTLRKGVQWFNEYQDSTQFAEIFPAVPDTFKNILQELSAQSDTVHPALLQLVTQLEQQHLGFKEEGAFRYAVWQEQLGVELPSSPEQSLEVIEGISEFMALYLSHNTVVFGLVNQKSLNADDQRLEAVQYLPLMTIADLKRCYELCVNLPEGLIVLQTIVASYFAKVQSDHVVVLSGQNIERFSQHLFSPTLREELPVEQFFAELVEVSVAESLVEVAPEHELFTKLPKAGTPEYERCLTLYVTWAKQQVLTRAGARQIMLPHDDSFRMTNGVVDKLLGGIMRYEARFTEILEPQYRNEIPTWSFDQVCVIAILLEFEQRDWRGNGYKQGDKRRFANDLLLMLQQD